MSAPRSEYPRPQFARPNWLCLNGEWQFEIDSGDSGIERGLLTQELKDKITVPFCPESSLSGIGNLDFLNVVWYRRTVQIPADWSGKRVLLHFQAVDYDATVWANGVEVARHRGGFTPFTADLRGIAKAGEEITIVVRARDANWIPQPRGKQASGYAPHDCHYTRTTGIWQTVWLEPVPDIALRRPRLTPDVANGIIRLEQPLTGNAPGLKLRARAKSGDGVATAEVRADLDLSPRLDLVIPEDKQRLWSPADPHLYDIEIELVNAQGEIVDSATSYTGLRSVAIVGKEVRINGETIFQRLVLDQGYYPDGVMTAPTDAALVHDIQLSLDAGFNGARLHQKVFEERFLYHADKMGYLVWGEFGDWGCGGYGPGRDHQQPGATYITQWLEAVERDYSHPAIVGWCPLNETHQEIQDRIGALDDVTRGMYLATKALDTSRPVLDSSGYSHRVRGADIYDSHDYIGEAEFAEGLANFKKRHEGMAQDKVWSNPDPAKPRQWSVPYEGQPYFVSEFGGFKWSVEKKSDSWGYGSAPVSLEDFYHRFEEVCNVLLDNPYMFGYCYTQLTDIFPEENGIYTFDRASKFDLPRLKAIQERIAAIEKKAAS